MSRYKIENILDDLLFSHDRLIRREIDASTCRTKYDWDQLHRAQDAHQTAKELAISKLLALIEGK